MKKIICALLALVMVLTLVLSAVATVSAANNEIEFDDLLVGSLPGTPVVTVAAETTEGTPVVISWEETTNTVSYTVVIADKATGDEVEKIENATSPVEVELPVGQYVVTVYAYSAQNQYSGSEAEFAVKGAYLVGDTNEDGALTDADAIYLLRHVLFPDTFPVNQPADYNSDDELTDADAIYLLRHVLFPDTFPLFPAK